MKAAKHLIVALAGLTALGGLLIAAHARADADASDTVEVCGQAECSEIYPAMFFDRYSPVNALEMVENLPAFSLDNGGGSRGFAGSAGNILINGERVSAKSERPSDLLRSIPSARVESIEVIRGQSGSGLLRGQTVIANIRLTRDSRSATWTLGSNFYNPGSREPDCLSRDDRSVRPAPPRPRSRARRSAGPGRGSGRR